MVLWKLSTTLLKDKRDENMSSLNRILKNHDKQVQEREDREEKRKKESRENLKKMDQEMRNQYYQWVDTQN